MNHPFAMNEARLNQLKTLEMQNKRRTLQHIFITIRFFIFLFIFFPGDTFSITGHLDPRLGIVSEDECNVKESDSGYFAVLFFSGWTEGKVS